MKIRSVAGYSTYLYFLRMGLCFLFCDYHFYYFLEISCHFSSFYRNFGRIKGELREKFICLAMF
jgi:hypothetical protein